MVTQDNKALIVQFLNDEKAVWKGGDILAFLEQFFSRDLIMYDPISGKGDVMSFAEDIETLRDGFPDMDWTIDAMVAEGDMVATRLTLRGTHQGEFMGVKPTGKQVTFTQTAIARVKDGKVVEGWLEADYLGLLQQLGVVAPLG